jgi:hypothetical protein
MTDDPIVAEVRVARELHAKKFNYDLKAIVADLKKRQKTSGHKIVSFPAKKPLIMPKRKAKVESGE